MNFINEVLSKNFINNQQILSICAKKKKFQGISTNKKDCLMIA